MGLRGSSRHGETDGGLGVSLLLLGRRGNEDGAAAALASFGRSRPHRPCCAKKIRTKGKRGARGSGQPREAKGRRGGVQPSSETKKCGGGNDELRQANSPAWRLKSKGE